MLTVKWRDGLVSWIDAKTVLVDPPSARVDRVLSKRAVDTRPIEEEGVHGEEVESIEPGTQRHARAALRTLPDALILVDDTA